LERTRITVIGAGSVGAAAAHRLAEGRLGDVVLVDVVEGLPQRRALDLAQAAPLARHDCRVVGANDYDATAGSQVIVVAAGLTRRPGMSRDELREGNARIVAACVQRACKVSRESTVVVVTSPPDVMCEVTRRVSGFPRERIVGMAGIVNSTRLRALVAAEMDVSSESVFALVLGGRGDGMVPLPRLTTVSGVPVTELLPRERIDALVERTAREGGEAVEPAERGADRFAPAAGVYEMVESIVRDRKKILPCSVYLQGEFGLSDVWVGVPCRLGRAGMEGVFEIKLTADEQARLAKAAGDVKAQMARLPAELGAA
jgi:malate dehydrogenase